MDEAELRINRLNTTAFIAVKPSQIRLTPVERRRTAGKGYDDVDLDQRAVQTFRIIELGANQTPPIIQLTDGQQRAADFWLLGEWDADIAVNDHWTDELDGREWLVGDIVRPNGYEMRALVTERGK